MDANDIFSFKSIRNIISQFRQVNRYEGNRIYDEPGTFFWKPIFYFYNGDSESNSIGLGNAGLLYPSWITNPEYKQVEDESNVTGSEALCKNTDAVNDAQLVNCAYNYLLRNNELKRAALLKNFIELLSDISSKTPWYFKEVSGLDEAVSKKSFFESPKIDENRKQITITCLADSADTRIGNMLDMYKSACYSWQTKRVIIPANLRKFDMGIYVFLRPYQEFYNEKKSILNSSHKYLEFHNCEIDLDSCKIGDAFNNEAASLIEYKIVISYDNCYDNRYSDFHNGIIGDAIMTDMIADDDKTKDADNVTNLNGEYGVMSDFTSRVTIDNKNIEDLKKIALKQPLDINPNKKNIYYGDRLSYSKRSNILTRAIDNAIDATVGTAKQALRSGVGGFLLGNLYHESIAGSLRDIRQGRLVSGVADVINNFADNDTYKRPIQNIYGTVKSEAVDKIKKSAKAIKSLGNLNSNKSTINNI